MELPSRASFAVGDLLGQPGADRRQPGIQCGTGQMRKVAARYSNRKILVVAWSTASSYGQQRVVLQDSRIFYFLCGAACEQEKKRQDAVPAICRLNRRLYFTSGGF
jgi:hypothetical protein